MKNSVRSACIFWMAAGVVIFLVSACSRGGTDKPPDTAAPTVPTNVQATTLSPDVIVLTWSPSSDDAGVTQYEVYVGGVPIVSLPSTTTMFLYSGLTPSTEYCCTVRAIDAAGNESALSDPPACAITTSVADVTLPTVSSTFPANGALNVAVDTKIQAVFSEPMDPGTITAPSNFACFDTSQIPSISVPGLTSYDGASKTASFTPTLPLAHNIIYECRISKNVTDLLGHGMAANYTWHFFVP
jgi:Bacterial Ig-like domain/Fibronectin type III domain